MRRLPRTVFGSMNVGNQRYGHAIWAAALLRGERFGFLRLTKCSCLQVTKPLLERKRRARINRCLDELKELMVGALEVSVSKKKARDISLKMDQLLPFWKLEN